MNRLLAALLLCVPAFAQNTLTPGLVVPLAADPTNCTVGMVYFNTGATAGNNLVLCTASNTWTAITGSGGGGTFDPFGAVGTATTSEWDDFYCDNNTTSSIGKLGWVIRTTSSGTANCPTGAGAIVANHPGIIYLSTGGTSASISRLELGKASSAFDVYPSLAVAGWEMQWIVKVSTAITSETVRIGVAYANAATDVWKENSAGYFEFDPTVSANWTYNVCGSSTCNSPFSSGVAVSTANWYRLRLRSTTNGTTLFSVSTNGGSFSAEVDICSSSCTVTATVPTTTAYPAMSIVTNTAADRRMLIDSFAAQFTSLVR